MKFQTQAVVGTCLLAILTLASAAADLPIEEQWSGVSTDALKPQAPASLAVVDEKSWATLWKAWRGDEALPAVDFSKSIVIVVLVDGPNRARVGKLTADDKGNVSALAMSTRMAGPGFGYVLVKVKKEGITAVEGHPLPAPASQPATLPKGAATQK